jgi:hypothetical protein
MEEASLILRDPTDTHVEPFAGKPGKQSMELFCGVVLMDGVDHKRPVHHLVAVDQMAIEDESQRGMLVSSIVRGLVGRGVEVE